MYSGINCYSTPSAIVDTTPGVVINRSFVLLEEFADSVSSFRAKLVPLFEYISWHRFRRARYLVRQFKNDLIMRSLINSKWTVLVIRHTNTHLLNFYSHSLIENRCNPRLYCKKVLEFVFSMFITGPSDSLYSCSVHVALYAFTQHASNSATSRKWPISLDWW